MSGFNSKRQAAACRFNVSFGGGKRFCPDVDQERRKQEEGWLKEKIKKEILDFLENFYLIPKVDSFAPGVVEYWGEFAIPLESFRALEAYHLGQLVGEIDNLGFKASLVSSPLRTGGFDSIKVSPIADQAPRLRRRSNTIFQDLLDAINGLIEASRKEILEKIENEGQVTLRTFPDSWAVQRLLSEFSNDEKRILQISPNMNRLLVTKK